MSNRKEYTLPNGKKAVFEHDACGIGKITLECMNELMSMIADTPQIVRCKECKHYNGHYCFNFYSMPIKAPKANDFCSWGERRGQ